MKRQDVRSFADPALAGRLADPLSASGALAGIAASVIAAVARDSQLVELAAGEALVREGEAATAEVYLLVEGSLVVQSKAGFIARLDKPGDVIGEVAVMLSSKRTADVLAESGVRVLAVPTPLLARPEFADVAAGIRGAMLRDDWVQY
jgi:CRP-like cAMP-binding protein